MEKVAKEIVLTGGPCSGKTTAINYIAEKLRDKGFRVFVVQEFATMLILAGVGNLNKLEERDPERYLKVEEQMLLMHLETRKRFNAIARIFNNEKSVILYDRGAMDVKAYMPEGYFEVLLEKNKLKLPDVMDAYDGVVHLVTTAIGAEEFYTLKNNKARRENLEEARMADEKTRKAWFGHPHLRTSDNSSDFKFKLKRTLQIICRLLGIPVPLEIERKFLLKRKPDFRNTYLKASQKVFIEQMYLKSKEENEERRIRKRYQEKMGSAYYQTFKESVPSIKRSEREEMISALEFFQLQKLILPGTSPVVKNRFCFMYKNQYFELDQILSPKKMWLLEIELTEENDKLELPPFLKIEKEVTGDKKYSNYEISKNN